MQHDKFTKDGYKVDKDSYITLKNGVTVQVQIFEEIEYHTEWLMYEDKEQEPWDYNETFDNKKHATDYMRKKGHEGKVLCCCSIDKDLRGDEYGYGTTKHEALKALTRQVRKYGYKPYDPWD